MAEPINKTSSTQPSTTGAATGRSPGGDTPPASGGTSEGRNAAFTVSEAGAGQSIMQQVRSTATDALQTAKTNTSAKIEEQKTTLSSGLSNVAENVRKLGEGLSTGEQADPVSRFARDYSGAAADKLETVADYFNSHDLRAIYRDTDSFARQTPAIVVGGAFALGFLAARFLKSSNEIAGGYDEGSSRLRAGSAGRYPAPSVSTRRPTEY